jgi:hypothetical protein
MHRAPPHRAEPRAVPPPVLRRSVRDVLVLPGDQIYRMDFSRLVDFHRR